MSKHEPFPWNLKSQSWMPKTYPWEYVVDGLRRGVTWKPGRGCGRKAVPVETQRARLKDARDYLRWRRAQEVRR